MAQLGNLDGRDFGIRQIYRPAGQTRGRIIAIPKPGKDWRKPWAQDQVFWLRDFLREDFPQCAVYVAPSLTREREEAMLRFVARTGAVGDGTEVRHLHKELRQTMQDTKLRERAPVVVIAHRDAAKHVEEIVANIWEGERPLESCTPDLDALRGIILFGIPPSRDIHHNWPTWSAELGSFRPKVFLITHPATSVESVWLPHNGGLPEHRITHQDNDPRLPFVDENNETYKLLCKCLQDLLSEFLRLDSFNLDNGVVFHDRFKIRTWFTLRPQSPRNVTLAESRLPLGESSVPELWVHLRKNDVGFMTVGLSFFATLVAPADTMVKLALGDIVPDDIIKGSLSEPLGTILQARSNAAHSRYVLPDFEVKKLELTAPGVSGQQPRTLQVSQVRIILPYLQWTNCATFAASKSKEVGTEEHPRRTLDQFHCPRMKDTSARDEDQVVSRMTTVENSPGHSKMIMVDQLWLFLWVVETNTHADCVPPSFVSSRVLTSFSPTSYNDHSEDVPELCDATDLLETVVEDMESGNRQFRMRPSDSAPNAAASILSKAILSLLSMKEDSLKFLDLFHEAIGDATDEYDEFLRTFKGQGEELSRPLDETDAGADYDGDTADTNTMTRKINHIRLASEIEDIVDELQMLKQLFTTQISILERGSKDLAGWSNLTYLRYPIQDVLHRLSTQYAPQIDGMLSGAEHLGQRLFDLKTLQQKEEDIQKARTANRHAVAAGQQALFTAKQALSAQDQADAAEAQSWILFIFTVVTIVFLPLSFFTSYFGMFDVQNNKNKPGEKPTYSPSYVGKVMWGFSGPFYTVAPVAEFVAFRLTTKSSAKARTRELLILEYKHQLPAKLIDEDLDSTEFNNMSAMRDEVKEQLKAQEQIRQQKAKDLKKPSDTTTTTPEVVTGRAAAESQSFMCRKMLPFSRRSRRNDVETAQRN